jgi:hypothetical protein
LKIIKEHIKEIWQKLNRELVTSYPFPDALFISVNEKEWRDVHEASILLEEREQAWLKEGIKKGTTTIEEYMSHEIKSTHAQIDDNLSHGGMTLYRQRSARLLVKELPKHRKKGFMISLLKICANHRFVSIINEHAVKNCVKHNKNSVDFLQLCLDIITHETIHVYELVRVKAFPEDEFIRLNQLVTSELFGFILKLSEKVD